MDLRKKDVFKKDGRTDIKGLNIKAVIIVSILDGSFV